MPATYTVIQKIDVGSGGASVLEFPTVPSTYTDLVIVLSVRYSVNALNDGYAFLQFNNDGGSNYAYKWVRAYTGTSQVGDIALATNSYILVTNNAVSATNTVGAFSSSEIYISGYTGTGNKMVAEHHNGENANTNVWLNLSAGRWTGTAAISSIKITSGAGTFVQHSSATLYGIKNS